MEITMRWRAGPNRAGRVHRRNSGGRRLRAAAATGAMVAVTMPALSADGAVEAPRSIEVTTGTDMIGLAGYPKNTNVKIEVLRQGFVVGYATKRTDSIGGVTMNHVGGLAGDCFDSPTSPDIQPTDTIRTTVAGSGGARDTSVVRGVWIDNMDFSGTTITVTGHVDVAGPDAIDPATDGLLLRIDKDADWAGLGTSSLREEIGPDVQSDGTWTHVITASAFDVVDARDNGETTLAWSGVSGTELTTAEYGPQEPIVGCPAPASGPTAPRLITAHDTGQVGDHLTSRSTDLTFSGLAETSVDVGAGDTIKLQVDGIDAAEVTADANGVYRFTGVNLSERDAPHTIRVISPTRKVATSRLTVDAASPGVRLRKLGPSPFRLTGADQLKAVYRTGEAATLRARIEQVNPTNLVKVYAKRTQAAGLAEFTWTGKSVAGLDVQPGRYQLILEVTDKAGNVTVRRDAFRVAR